MTEISDEKLVPYQLRITNNLNVPKWRVTYYGADTVRFMGQRVQAKLSTEIKTSSSLAVFTYI